MGLLATVQAGIDTAFTEAGDLVGEFWLTRKTDGVYDFATGDSVQVEVEFMFEGVVDTVFKSPGFGDTSVGSNGSEVDGETRRVYLKPNDGIEPKIGDQLRAGEDAQRIVDVLPVTPDGQTVLLWELVVKV